MQKCSQAGSCRRGQLGARQHRLAQQVARAIQIGEDRRRSYLDSEPYQGTVIGVSETSDAKGRFFERIVEIAASCDGRGPVPLG